MVRRGAGLAAMLGGIACGGGSAARDSFAGDSTAAQRAQPTVDSIAMRDSLRVSSESSSPWQLDPSGRTGPITRQTSEAELVATYGSDVVRAVRVQIGEGDTAPGSILFSDDSTRRLEIIWGDTVARRHPARIILRGDRSQWTLARGVTLGMPLRDIERLNTGPFRLAGFSGDYGGVVIDWDAGRLKGALDGATVYFTPERSQEELPAYAEVVGDREFASSLGAMQTLNPRISQIFIDFAPPTG
jgi:hypothetical protein